MIQSEKESDEKTPVEVATPKGWEVSEIAVDPISVMEQQNIERLRKKIGLEFPFIASSVEEFIGKVWEKFNILVSQAYISFNIEAVFLVTLLVNKEDYFSPMLYAAKIKADQFLTTFGNVSMRYKFTIEDEYLKSHFAEHDDKLRYSFKNPLIANSD